MRLIDPEQITKMMSDLYISEDAVNMTRERQGLWVRFRAIEKAVSEMPTIDAVEVVRCKDCKHRQEDECPMFFEEQIDIDEGDGYYDTNHIFHDYTQDDGYCSWGERREP